MKSTLKVIGIVLVLFLLQIVFIKSINNSEDQNLSGGFAKGEYEYISSAGAGNAIAAGQSSATTTPVYMVVGATASSTLQGPYGLATSLNLDINAIGSSSAAVLGFTIETSENQIDWYPIDQSTTTNSSVHDAVETRNTFSLATTSATGNTVRKHFNFEFGAAAYYRVRFGVSGANAAVHARGFTTDQTPN